MQMYDEAKVFNEPGIRPLAEVVADLEYHAEHADDAERQKLAETVRETICVYCGTPLYGEPCHCTNDD